MGSSSGGAGAGDAGAAADSGREFGDPELTYLSQVDRSPDGVVLSPDRLSAEWLGLANYGVRSTRAIAPHDGVFYFEVYADLDFFDVGVATAQASLNAGAGESAEGFSVDVGGVLSASGTQAAASFERSPHGEYGFVVDYRGDHPDVYVIAGTGDDQRLLAPRSLSAIGEPLFIHLSGLRRTPGYQVTINPGNDTTNCPFVFDPRVALYDEGHREVAAALVPGWGTTRRGDWNEPPSLELTSPAPAPLSVGESLTLSASASDAEDGDRSAEIMWDVQSSGIGPDHVGGRGPTFTFTPAVIGRHPIRVSVTDAGGKRAEQIITVEATGSLPQFSEVRLVQEPGLTGEGIQLSSDGLRAHWTLNDKLGVRANQGLYGDFWYMEGHRLVGEENQAIGLVIGEVSLNPYPFNTTPPSCSVNSVGPSMFRDLIFAKSFSQPASEPAVEYYGLAVDYRDAYPIAYVILAGQLAAVLELTDVTVPVYPMLYGNVNEANAAYDMEINFGATPFHEDPAAVLQAAGVDASELKRCWGNSNAACQ